MRNVSRVLGAALLGAAVTAAFAAAVAVREYAPVRTSPTNFSDSADGGRVIVKFRDRSTTLSAATSGSIRSGPQAATTLGARLGVSLKDGRVLGTRTQVLMASSMSSTDLATTLAKQSDVEWVEVDHRRFAQLVPNDLLYPGGQSTTTPTVGQWYLRAPDVNSGVVSSINVEPAWDITQGSSTVVIADVDTGITSHPDLSSKVFTATFSGTTAGVTPYGYDFVGYGGDANGVARANDGNAADPDPSDPGDDVTSADVARGGAFFGMGCTVENSSWHGTQTAGILGAATNNITGMAGTAFNTMIVPVRALGKCGGYDSDIIAAAEWAGGVLVDTSIPANTHPARVINMSLGGTGSCGSDYQEAFTLLRNHQVLVVVAAGNDTGLPVDAPANCEPASGDDPTPIVVAVAGLRQSGDKVGYSDIGPQIKIAAPAGNCVNTASNSACLYPILTTTNTGTTSPVAATYSTSFGEPSLGTSFATPMVTGTIALMLASNPWMSNAQVISALQTTARQFPTSGGSANTPMCTTPSSSTTQDECYCTTSTCGAGMLDAGAAVTAASTTATSVEAPVATISGATTVVAGSTITLSALDSTGISLTYAWTITSGGASALLNFTSGNTVTLTGVAAGSADLQLTVTDSTGAASTTTSTITVTAAPSSGGGTSTGGGSSTGSGGTTTSNSSGGGGGGAASPAWLLLLAVAGLLLTPRRARRDDR